jgi:hypothetical protein
MTSNDRPLRHDRLSELVTHLSGAPMDHARVAVSDAADRNGVWGDSLLNIADALVTLRAVS